MARVARGKNAKATTTTTTTTTEAVPEKAVITGGGRKRKVAEVEDPPPSSPNSTATKQTKTADSKPVEAKSIKVQTSTTSTQTQSTKATKTSKPSTAMAKGTKASAKSTKSDSTTTTKEKTTSKPSTNSKLPSNQSPKAKTKTIKQKADSIPPKELTPADTDVDMTDAAGDTAERPTKKAKVVGAEEAVEEKPVPKAFVAPLPKGRHTKVVRERSQTKMKVFVFGKGDMCELGLGPKERQVTRPRVNPFLPIDTVGVVDVAVGGMHTAVLTHDGTILTWGVNDQNALGRNTAWEAPVIDINDASSDTDSDDGDINPVESTPGPVEGLPKGVDIVTVACSDSLTCALTSTGFVYAWGTFRCSDGILGFSETQHVAQHPVLLPNLKNIVELVTGTDHILARSSTGAVYAWGNGQQFQLGRRVIERTRLNGLTPREFGLRKARSIGAGSYHSFAVLNDGKVMAWGLNQYGQCGINMSEAQGEDGSAVSKPTLIEGLRPYDIIQITGGEHHSAAVTKDGKLLVWGRLDANQLGIPHDQFPKDITVFDEHGKPRFIPIPTLVPGLPPIASIACGTHHNIAIARDGTSYSWGFGENFQVGQGPKGEDILTPTQIMNTAIKEVSLCFAGCGGQFSVMAGTDKPAPAINGVKDATT